MINIEDRSQTLPRHATKRYARRPISKIQGVVFHQSLGNGGAATAAGINAYHIGPTSHLAPGGAPRIAYYAFVEPDGKVVICNDMEDITWSQGGQPCPHAGCSSNTSYLSVCFGGDFAGKDHKGGSPTDAQLKAAKDLLDWLKQKLPVLDQSRLFGHDNFGKPACPGTDLRAFIDSIRYEGVTLPKKDEDTQSLLVKLGYDLGTTGKKGNGVDGDWGKVSQSALEAFCHKENLVEADRKSDQVQLLLALRGK